MDDKSKRAGIDWLKIFCVVGIFSVALFSWLKANSKDGSVPLLIDSEGQSITKRVIQVYYPDMAGWLGIRSR